jgi:hypothetical protein
VNVLFVPIAGKMLVYLERGIKNLAISWFARDVGKNSIKIIVWYMDLLVQEIAVNVDDLHTHRSGFSI